MNDYVITVIAVIFFILGCILCFIIFNNSLSSEINNLNLSSTIILGGDRVPEIDGVLIQKIIFVTISIGTIMWVYPNILKKIDVEWANKVRRVIKRFLELLTPYIRIVLVIIAWIGGHRIALYSRLCHNEDIMNFEIGSCFDWWLKKKLEIFLMTSAVVLALLSYPEIPNKDTLDLLLTLILLCLTVGTYCIFLRKPARDIIWIDGGSHTKIDTTLDNEPFFLLAAAFTLIASYIFLAFSIIQNTMAGYILLIFNINLGSLQLILKSISLFVSFILYVFGMAFF